MKNKIILFLGVIILLSGCHSYNKKSSDVWSIDYPISDLPMQCIDLDPRTYRIKMREDGRININGKSVLKTELSEIIKNGITQYGIELPLLLLIDKHTNTTKISPLISILKRLKIQNVRMAIKIKNSNKLYYLQVNIHSSQQKFDSILNIRKTEIMWAGHHTNVLAIREKKQMLYDRKILIKCAMNLSYQRVIDVLSSLQSENIVLEITNN